MRAEKIPWVTRIQKIWGKLCASKNSFVHLLGMHWISGSQKYMPQHPAVSRCPLSLSRHHCAVWCSILSFCSVTSHAHRKSRVRSNNVPTRKVCVTLIYLYLLLFAVALLCCDMLWYSCKISFTDLLHAMLCSHSLIIHVYLMFLYTES